MKPSDFFSLTVNSTPHEERRTKADMRPFGGRPGGVDPYPDKSDDMPVLLICYGVSYEVSATVFGDPFELGSRFVLELEGRPPIQLTVEEITHSSGPWREQTQNILARGEVRAKEEMFTAST